MGQKRYTAEQIIGKLRQEEVRSTKGKRVADILREPGISKQTYYRWQREYGGLKVTQAKSLKFLDRSSDALAELFEAVRQEPSIRRLPPSIGHREALLKRWRHRSATRVTQGGTYESCSDPQIR